MSTFEDSRYRWRETYFVFFEAKKRPKLTSVAKALSALNKRFQLTAQTDDEHGQIDSLTLISPDDYAALDICFTEGDEVLEQVGVLVEDVKKADPDSPPPVPWTTIKKYDGRFDILHFEQVPEDVEEDDGDDGMLDPSALLVVLGTLARLTHGVAIDPQAGTFLTDE
jgi:hypothetical protein